MDAFADRGLRVRLGDVDKFVYMNRLDVRTQVVAQQASANLLPSCTLLVDYLQTATYLVRTRAEYNEIDVAEFGEWNVALPAGQRLGMRQGTFQYIRTAALFGVNASNSEGLLNTPGATVVSLPPDTYGDTTILTYDSGQLAIFWLLQIQAAIQRMYFAGMPNRVVLLGPQRILLQMQMTNIVQTTSFQRQGAGTATTAQVLKEVCAEFGISLEFAFDDTLIGAGAGSTSQHPVDAVLLVIPEAHIATVPGVNTNEFATLTPSIQGMTLQYANVPAPIEVTTPIVEGLDVTSSMRVSSGWCPRSQAITIVSVPYS
jgi:hypothetical protein